MFLPTLLPEHAIDGLRAYPDAPVFEETSDRGAARGTRTERVTLVAEGGGSGVAPEVTLDWYNLATGAVETARLPAFSLSVEGPPAATVGSEARDWRAIGLQGLAVFGLLAMCLLVLRYLAPPLKSWFHQSRADWMASETRAWRGLCRVVRARDYTALRPALELWAARTPGPNPRQDVRLSSVLTTIGGTRYGNTSGGNASSGWRELDRVLKQLRRQARHKSPTAALQPLNPRT
jgi:hypothetical protein